jgi:hypothetical protein
VTIDDNERKKIEEHATRNANVENRLTVLESKVTVVLYGLGAAAALLASTFWDGIKSLVIK